MSPSLIEVGSFLWSAQACSALSDAKLASREKRQICVAQRPAKLPHSKGVTGERLSLLCRGSMWQET
jgi:hypothetical protein